MASDFQKLIYTSPSGQSQEFLFSDELTKKVERRTASFDFEGRDLSFVQDGGWSSPSYPVDCFVTSMATADRAEEILKERTSPTRGTLQHPAFGTLKKVVVGSFTRSVDTVAALNIFRFSITFVETFDLSDAPYLEGVLPTDTAQPSAMAFLSQVVTGSTAAVKSLTGAINTALGKIDDFYSNIFALSNEALSAYNDVMGAVQHSVSTLIENPLELDKQMQTVFDIFLGSGDDVNQMLDETTEMAISLMSVSDKPISQLPATAGTKNVCVWTDFMGSSLLRSAMNAALSSNLTRRNLILSSAGKLSALYALVRGRSESWEGIFTKDGVIAQNQYFSAQGALVPMQSALSAALESLQSRAQSAKSARSVTLESDAPLLSLSYALLGSIADQDLQNLIDDNALSFDEILLVPKGRKILYFV